MFRIDALRHYSQLSHPDLCVDYGIRSRDKDRHAFIINGLSGPNRVLQINDGSIHTLRTALLERMFYHAVDGVYMEPPQISRMAIEKTLGQFRSKVVRCYGQRPTPVSPEQFVEMYEGRRKTIMEQALLKLDRVGLKRSDGYTRAFVKLEKVKKAKAPRCIQPRTPEYNICVGVYLKPIEHPLYRAIQRAIGSATPVVAKGLNAQEVGEVLYEKWLEFDDPIAIGLDAEAFDLHVCASMLGWEHSVYESLYSDHYRVSDLKRLLTWQIHNSGVGYCYDGKLKYRVKGRRFSGDMNTAMGNCLIMCGVVQSYCSKWLSKYQFINNGDDCVVIVERRECHKFDAFKNHAHGLGFRIKLEPPVDCFEEIEFCQQRPVYLRDGYVMVRTPDKAREKDSMSLLHHQNIETVKRWLTAVGECGMALCSGCPVMQEFYLALLRSGKAAGGVQRAMGMDTGSWYLARGMDNFKRPVTPEARVSYYKAFGVTPDEQVAMEQYYQNWSIGNQIVDGDVDMVETAPM